jgi:hypothetical protein
MTQNKHDLADATGQVDFDKCKDAVAIYAERLGIRWDRERSRGVDVYLPFIERIGAEGGHLFWKIDGGRTRPDDRKYTAHVHGARLPEDVLHVYRIDAHSPGDALSYVIARWGESYWS